MYRRGALIIRQLCVLLDAEKVYRELSVILEGEDDLDFASIRVQVCLCNWSIITPQPLPSLIPPPAVKFE